MKLLTPIAAIVSLAASGQVFHSPSEIYQSLDFHHQPVYQLQQFQEHHPSLQIQHDVKPIHEVQIEHQPIQHVQIQHQQEPVRHQVIQHIQPQVEQHHGFGGFKGFEGFQAHQSHQSTPQLHQSHQVHQPQVQSHHIHQSPAHNFHQAQGFESHGHQEGGPDKAAKILNYQHDSDGHNYQYMYETENGIKIQEVGSTAGKGSQAQGAYSYKGDDGQIYTVTYTADENGFQAQGAHLPTPPPMPEEIARSIEQNAKDEANGIVDDGQYQSHHHQGHQQQAQGHQQQQEYQQLGYQQRHNFGQQSNEY